MCVCVNAEKGWEEKIARLSEGGDEKMNCIKLSPSSRIQQKVCNR